MKHGEGDMQWTTGYTSRTTILLVAFLTVLLSSFVLFALNQIGIIAFTGTGWLVNFLNRITEYLGYSTLFFMVVLLGYFQFFFLLRKNLRLYQSELKEEQWQNIRYYNSGIEIFITLFFAIGVLFTAWGLQNALVSALGGVSKEEAARMGAWGILKRMVDNGVLVALWTTIAGGAGGYLMRIIKYFSLGKELGYCSSLREQQARRKVFDILESIEHHLALIEQDVIRPV